MFAIGASLAGLVSAIASSVSMVSLPAQLNRCDVEEKRYYVTAVFGLSLAVAVVATVTVFPLFLVTSAAFGLSMLSTSAAWMAVAAGLLNTLWAVCVEILTIEGRAKRYAVTTFAQALANIIAVLAAVFLVEDVDNALFWGFLAAAIVGFAGAVLLLYQWLVFSISREWCAQASRGAKASVVAALSENGKVALERSYLGAMLGIFSLGVYAHAQYYKGAAMAALNAISRSVLPTALREAQDDEPNFPDTLRLWAVVQAFVVSAVLGFALVGREVVGWLTHGKFLAAAPLATVLMIVLLLQTSAKPHMTLLLSRGRGSIIANLNTLSVAISVIWLLVSVPWMGVWGAVSALALQIVIHRVGVYRAANAVCRIQFSDQWVVTGVVVSGLFLATIHFFDPSIALRSATLLVCYAVLFWKLKPAFTLLMSTGHSHER